MAGQRGGGAGEHQGAGPVEELGRAAERGGEAVVGQDGEVHVEQPVPGALDLDLEVGHLVLQASLAGQLARGGEGQPRQKAAAGDAARLALERLDDGVAGAAARREQGPRREQRHLRGDLHEGREVEVEAALHVAHQADAARDLAAQRRERLGEALVREGAGDRPGERRRRPGERLAHVGARPDRVDVPAFGEAAAGDRPHLEEPYDRRRVAGSGLDGELDVERRRLAEQLGRALFEAVGEAGDDVERGGREGGGAGARLGDDGLFDPVGADDQGAPLVGQHRQRGAAVAGEAHGVGRRRALDHGGAEAQRGVDEPLVGAPVLPFEPGGRRGEEDARRLGRDHELEDHRHPEVADAGVGQVGQRPRQVGARPHLADGVGEASGAARAEHRRGEPGQ